MFMQKPMATRTENGLVKKQYATLSPFALGAEACVLFLFTNKTKTKTQ
jgi:hypothetical protein